MGRGFDDLYLMFVILTLEILCFVCVGSYLFARWRPKMETQGGRESLEGATLQPTAVKYRKMAIHFWLCASKVAEKEGLLG